MKGANGILCISIPTTQRPHGCTLRFRCKAGVQGPEACCDRSGGVGAIVTLLLREPGGAPPELGPIRCIGVGPAAVFTRDLAEACNPFMISLIHGYGLSLLACLRAFLTCSILS